jgi:hypothetical protein
MGRRLYEVQFESWDTTADGGRWSPNWSKRCVVVAGGAEAAIAEAKRREKGGGIRVRAEVVRLLGEED